MQEKQRLCCKASLSGSKQFIVHGSAGVPIHTIHCSVLCAHWQLLPELQPFGYYCWQAGVWFHQRHMSLSLLNKHLIGAGWVDLGTYKIVVTLFILQFKFGTRSVCCMCISCIFDTNYKFVQLALQGLLLAVVTTLFAPLIS